MMQLVLLLLLMVLAVRRVAQLATLRKVMQKMMLRKAMVWMMMVQQWRRSCRDEIRTGTRYLSAAQSQQRPMRGQIGC
uniref:Putative secreted protein n=1 Tax=Anopheles triannulatus TaxID=58253 RepID=A0A2M4B2E1_9DIPT